MKTLNFLLLPAIISLSMLSSAATAGAQSVHWEFPFQNPALTADKRAEDLVGRLTLGEKVGLMTNESQPVERLGIKPYNWWNEGLHGVARAGLATVYPQAIGMAATFDTVLVRRVFSDVSDEARAKHAEAGRNGERGLYQGLTFWTPNINIFRDPRWGRGQETYGEDPYLTSRMAVAVIEGLQGGSPAKRAASRMRYDKLHACAKHFAVHSGPEWNRHTFNVADLSPRDLYETYLPAFKAAVTEAGVKEVMCSYNGLDGQPCCGNSRLLTKILRNEWHFDGIVVSDCGAVSDFFAPWGHKSYPDAESASAAALKAGTDITCMNEFSSLFEAVKDGKSTSRTLMRA
jgi:beta-glucosidase